MSMVYCEYCHLLIDTDWIDDHFDEDGNCEKEKREKE